MGAVYDAAMCQNSPDINQVRAWAFVRLFFLVRKETPRVLMAWYGTGPILPVGYLKLYDPLVKLSLSRVKRNIEKG